MDRARNLDQLRSSFGAQTLSPEERGARVNALFDRIAPRYDLMNDLMSFGMHRLWKAVTVAWARRALAEAPQQDGGQQDGAAPLVDLAGGTGDIALALARAEPQRRVLVADASEGMLAVARRRGGDRLDYLHAQAEALPLPSGSVALVTLAFGLRNMTDPAAALAEVTRVLEPGGSLILLEFSRPAGWFAPFYGLHARFVIPALGALVAGDRGAYRYLVESIQRFPARDDIAREIAKAGLQLRRERAFVFGIARLQWAVRPAPAKELS